MDPSLRQAVLGSASIQTPTSPLGSFPELAALHQSSFQLGQSSGAASALANNAQQTVAEQKAIAEAKKKQVSNYQRLKKSDGGYTFVDPDGKEISAYEYANAIGKSPSDVLKDSENPLDIGYQQDFKNLSDYINSKLNSKYNSEAESAARQTEKQVKDSYGVDLGSMNPSELIDLFKSRYPTVYGGSNNGNSAGELFLPNKQANDLTGGSNAIGG
jgi:hypothetical protein